MNSVCSLSPSCHCFIVMFLIPGFSRTGATPLTFGVVTVYEGTR